MVNELSGGGCTAIFLAACASAVAACGPNPDAGKGAIHAASPDAASILSSAADSSAAESSSAGSEASSDSGGSAAQSAPADPPLVVDEEASSVDAGEDVTMFNSCAVNHGGCDTHATCTSSGLGTNSCHCMAGFSGSGMTCTPMDACASSNGGCDGHATCTSTGAGTSGCTCNGGYSGNGVSCAPIDLCVTNNGGCDPNAMCRVTGPGTRSCGCNGGYSGNGVSCAPIDPCMTNNGGCDRNATCTVTGPGTDSCTCNTGYYGSGIACTGCGIGAGSVDQEQLASGGNYVVSPAQIIGQTFVLGTSGILAGIEFGLASCNGVDPKASIVVTVTRASTTIATASLPVSQLSTTSCGGISLSSSSVGAGFFDLNSQCVPASAGDNLTATLTIVGSTGACGTNRQCAGGPNAGRRCFVDSQCQYAARVGENGGGYANGSIVVNGSAIGGQETSFKVFVR